MCRGHVEVWPCIVLLWYNGWHMRTFIPGQQHEDVGIVAAPSGDHKSS